MSAPEMPERIWYHSDGAYLSCQPAEHGEWQEFVRADLCASGQQVRALEWYDCADGSSHDHDCQYEVEQDGKQWRLVRASTGPGGYLSHHQYRQGAKEAAQADYERRILAALTPAPQPEGQVRAGLVDVGKVVQLCEDAARKRRAQAAEEGDEDQKRRWIAGAIQAEILSEKIRSMPVTPLYAHPPQPNETVAEALHNLICCAEPYMRDEAQMLALAEAKAALRALKGGE